MRACASEESGQREKIQRLANLHELVSITWIASWRKRMTRLRSESHSS